MSQRPHTRWLWRLVLTAGLALVVLLPGVAAAQEGDYPPSTIPATLARCTAGTNASVCGTSAAASGQATASGQAESLPFTGGDVALLTVLGLGAAAGGVALVWIGRRRSGSAAS
jgi:hypothetical protein